MLFNQYTREGWGLGKNVKKGLVFFGANEVPIVDR